MPNQFKRTPLGRYLQSRPEVLTPVVSKLAREFVNSHWKTARDPYTQIRFGSHIEQNFPWLGFFIAARKCQAPLGLSVATLSSKSYRKHLSSGLAELGLPSVRSLLLQRQPATANVSKPNPSTPAAKKVANKATHFQPLASDHDGRFPKFVGQKVGQRLAAQYVELVQDRCTTGRVLGSTWIIRDAGNRGPENQCVGDNTEALNFSDTEALKNQHPVKPVPGKSAPIRRAILKENQKEETQGFFDEVQEAEKPKDDGFNDFWAAYPACQRKTGKPQAHQAWCRIIAGKAKEIPKTDAAVIIEAVKRFAASGADPQFIPLPTTWLNGARWDQFPAVSEVSKPGRSTWGEVVR
jgi:hypothetical protein